MAQGYVYEDDATGWRPITAADLPNSGVGAGTYGDATHVGQVTVDAHGLVTGAANVAIAAGGGTVSSIDSPGGSIGVTNPAGPTTHLDLPNSGATAGTYGDATHVSRVTVNALGIITGISNVGVSGLAGTGLYQIYDNTLGADTASIDTGAGAIPSGHQHLILVMTARGTTAATTADNVIQYNADTGANYDDAAGRDAAAAFSDVHDWAATNAEFGQIPAATATANYSATLFGLIASYDQTNYYKTMVYLGGFQQVAAASFQVWFGTSTWRSTAAITRIKVFPLLGSYKAGTRLTIYGTQ